MRCRVLFCESYESSLWKQTVTPQVQTKTLLLESFLKKDFATVRDSGTGFFPCFSKILQKDPS